MERFSEKVYLELPRPGEDMPVSDQRQLLLALEERGYENVSIPLPVLRQLYPLCRQGGITVTLVYRERDWAVTAIEAGDRRDSHYGLAVDYGSTTVVMELVDMNSGAVIAREQELNGQTVYGTDILSRITYAMLP